MTNQPENMSIADEFLNVPINDQRLVNRLIHTASMLEKQPEKSIPDACQNWAATKAAYHLFDHQKITPAVIQSGHFSNTIERIKNHPIVLQIQDTTCIDFTTLQKTKGLGPYTTASSSRGLLMHSVLAVTPTGVPLGLLYQDVWARDPETRGKRKLRRSLPIEEKESFKWLKAMEASSKTIPNTVKAVTVGDREADIFEFFQKAHQEGHHLLIRAIRNRRITEEHKLLRNQIENTPIAGECVIEIPRDTRHNLPPRQAKLNIRFCQVTVYPAFYRSQNPSGTIPLYVVLAQEIDPPSEENSIEWLLLTTIPVGSVQEAVQKIEWYRQRWKIERFHYVLKSGCQIEELQLETTERLKNAIALYSIVAWRLLWLTYQSRTTPDAPCTIILENQEWQALYCVVKRTKKLPKNPPTLIEAVLLMAKLGGFLARKGDGKPGVKVIWRGYQKLNEGLLFVEYFQTIQSSFGDMGNA
jgi:hypothetical protein